MATPVFCCGFECGVTGSHWTLGTGASFSTGTVRSGVRALRLNASASASSVASVAANFPLTGNKLVVRFYLHFTTLPTTALRILNIVNVGGTSGTTRQVGILFDSTVNKIFPMITGSAATGSVGASVTTGQWYRIDWKIDMSANPWVQALSVDGVEDAVTISLAADTFTANAQVVFGHVSTTSTFDIFYDDFLASQTTADYPLGAGYVNHFIPTADGTHNIAGTADFQRTLTGTDILNATTTAFQLVDDVPLESGASVDWINMLAPPNATDYVECVFGPASGISTPSVAPRAVEVIAGIHQAATGTGNMEIRLNDNGTTNAMYSATGVAGVTSVAYKRKHYATPPTGGAWTVAAGDGNFNNLKVRFGSPATLDVNPDQYFDCIMLEAEFIEVTVWTSTTKFLMLMGAGT